MPLAEQPQQRLAAQGPGALTDAELVAMVLGAGLKGATALELAHAALTRHGGLAALLGMLNTCAAGVVVVNIDNGFGAAAAATRINQQRTTAGGQ